MRKSESTTTQGLADRDDLLAEEPAWPAPPPLRRKLLNPSQSISPAPPLHTHDPTAQPTAEQSAANPIHPPVQSTAHGSQPLARPISRQATSTAPPASHASAPASPLASNASGPSSSLPLRSHPASAFALRLRIQPLPRRVPRPRCLEVPLRHTPPVRTQLVPHEQLAPRPRNVKSL